VQQNFQSIGRARNFACQCSLRSRTLVPATCAHWSAGFAIIGCMTSRQALDLAAALGVFREVLADLSGPEFGVKTCCAPWSVYDVVNHVAAVTMKFTTFASGETDAPRSVRGDVLARDPVSGFEATAVASQLAWASVDPARQCHLPFGVFTAAEAATVNMFDVLVHGWDIADAVSRPYRIPDDLLPSAIEMGRRLVSVDAVAAGQFAAAAGVVETQISQERLLELTGRR
jgi:uncharacterized protein (TIGR03086 family)